jgi:hypothetical protein
MRASANLASTSVSVVPGGEAEVPVTVRNAGDTVEAYRIEVLGVPAEWVTVEPATLNLYPAGSDTVTVTFRPPRSSRVDAGDVPFGVRVVPSEYPESVVVEEGVLTIEPFSEVAAQVQPPSRSGLRSARYRIDTDNLGNVPEQVGLAAAEGTDQVTFALPAEVAVPNGTRAETRLRVRARRLLWWGEPKEYPFAVELRPEDGRVRNLDARFVQRPVISAGLLKLLAALLALLLALAAIWFGLLRPQVETAAREAVEAERARQVAQDEPVPSSPAEPGAPGSSPGAPGSGAPDGGTPSGGANDGGGVGGPAGGLGGEQFSVAITFRTSPNGSAERSYTVPEGRTFLLTDFLVDNVQGDEGTLTVTANQVRVVTYALENFRNQDYHSVTPIRVPERARVTLTVVCRRPGQPANAPRATTCRESLYLNGVLTNAPEED